MKYPGKFITDDYIRECLENALYPVAIEPTTTLTVKLKHYGPDKHPSGSSQDVHGGRTTTVTIDNNTLTLDKKIANIIKKMNSVGLETTSSCIGHVCDDPISTTISYFIRGKGFPSHNKIEALIASGTLKHNWTLEQSANTRLFHMYITGGHYGDLSVKSTKQNVTNAIDDISTINDILTTSVQKHYGPGPHPSGSAQSVHGKRVWRGKRHSGTAQLSRIRTGNIGERVATRVLTKKYKTNFELVNVGLNNAPIDIAGDSLAVEVKTGVATNTYKAQHWRATIGQPGIKEQALLDKMTKDEKRNYNKYKQMLILERKNDMLNSMSSTDNTLKPLTVGVILSSNASKADVYFIPGFHLRLPWKDYATDEYYVGTYDV